MIFFVKRRYKSPIHEFHHKIRIRMLGRARFRNDCDELLIFQFFDVEQTIEFLKVTQDSSGRMFIPSSRTFQSGQNPVSSSIAKRFFRYIFWEWEGEELVILKRFLSFFFPNYRSLKNAHQRL